MLAVAELLAPFGSAVADARVAVLLMTLPGGEVTVTTSWTLTMTPEATVPSSQVTVPPPALLHVPWLGVALTNVLPFGSDWVSDTLTAPDRLLENVIRCRPGTKRDRSHPRRCP